MKSNAAILIITTFVAVSCNGWNLREKKMIDCGPELMRVLSVDDGPDREVLRRDSRDIPAGAIATETYKTLCRKMLATVSDPSQDGVGIAAPQVGISRRIVAVQRFDKPGSPFETYPNIRITQFRGPLVAGPEGCLSLPGRYGDVRRFRDITVTYTSPATLRDTTEDVSGFTAVIFQHECDHLDGIVFTDRIWGERDSWYRGTLSPGTPAASPDSVAAVTPDASPAVFPCGTAPADVFYLVATNVDSSHDADGLEVFNAVLSPGERRIMDRETAFIQTKMFGDSLNIYSPYYHQVTMNGFYRGANTYFERARLEVLDAFDYYIRHLNGGRPFVLAGFSQGAMMVLEILKNMDAGTYSRLMAAYVIGYGLSEADAEYPCVKPADGPGDTGACYSFNTVTDTSAIWNLVYNDAAYCINPANWKTDRTPATFEFEGQSVTTRVDTSRHVIISSSYTDPDTGRLVSGCLHREDLLFYTPFIRRDILDRVYERTGRE